MTHLEIDKSCRFFDIYRQIQFCTIIAEKVQSQNDKDRVWFSRAEIHKTLNTCDRYNTTEIDNCEFTRGLIHREHQSKSDRTLDDTTESIESKAIEQPALISTLLI